MHVALASLNDSSGWLTLSHKLFQEHGAGYDMPSPMPPLARLVVRINWHISKGKLFSLTVRAHGD